MRRYPELLGNHERIFTHKQAFKLTSTNCGSPLLVASQEMTVPLSQPNLNRQTRIDDQLRKMT